MSINAVSAVVAQLGTLAIMGAGVMVMIAGSSRAARAIAGRLILVGLVLGIASALVSPEWLP